MSLWFRSYHTNPKQITAVKNDLSEPKYIRSGVPQGTVIGPTLFLVFINDLGKSLKWSSYKMYADDVVIYSSDREIDEKSSENHLKSDLTCLQGWCQMNAITMNIKKTKYMKFGTRQQLENADMSEINLANVQLEQVQNYKILAFLESNLLYLVKQ